MHLDWMNDLPNLWNETYDLVAQVPEGKVTTYGEVAKALGDIVASRFVGLAMSRNDDIVRVPCRRVVQSDGFVGGYTPGGPTKKSRLLRAEGVAVRNGLVVDLEGVLFKDFKTPYPLCKVRAIQERLKKHLLTRRFKEKVVTVAGVDVAYEGEHGFAAMVSVDYSTGEVAETTIAEGDARFPYIPTYLSFREIPIIRPLLANMPKDTVVMYDGNGILHPHGFGIASQLGVAFDVPTVGIAKKLLCGELSGTWNRGVRPVVYKGRTIGHAIARRNDSKPVFASVGHRVSVEQAVDIARSLQRFRVPEPVRLAHIAAEAARRGRSNK
jgi:deoxyribonuclease V